MSPSTSKNQESHLITQKTATLPHFVILLGGIPAVGKSSLMRTFRDIWRDLARMEMAPSGHNSNKEGLYCSNEEPLPILTNLSSLPDDAEETEASKEHGIGNERQHSREKSAFTRFLKHLEKNYHIRGVELHLEEWDHVYEAGILQSNENTTHRGKMIQENTSMYVKESPHDGANTSNECPQLKPEESYLVSEKPLSASAESTFDPVKYKRMRDQWIQQLLRKIQLLGSGCHIENLRTDDSTSSRTHSSISNPATVSQIYIIEDNFYLNSMRRQIFLECEKIGIIYGEVILQCNLNDCMQRNESRDNSVPNQVIERMHQVFEYQPRNHEMSLRHLQLDTGTLSLRECFQKMCSFLRDLQPIESQKLLSRKERVTSTNANMENMKHQLEIHLRKCTRKIIVLLSNGFLTLEPSSVAKKIGMHRRNFILEKCEVDSHTEAFFRDHSTREKLIEELKQEFICHAISFVLDGCV